MHCRMQMGIAFVPNMFQSIMTEIMGDSDYVLIYIDNVLCLQKEGKSADDHLERLDMILSCLEKAGF